MPKLSEEVYSTMGNDFTISKGYQSSSGWGGGNRNTVLMLQSNLPVMSAWEYPIGQVTLQSQHKLSKVFPEDHAKSPVAP